MNSLLTPDFFKKDTELTLEEKVNIMFDSWKSTLRPLFIGNKFYYTAIEEKEFTYNPIFKNNWFKLSQFSEMGGKDYNTRIKEQNGDLIIKSLNIANHWHSYDVYSANKYDKIGIWFNVYIKCSSTDLTKCYFDLIKFSKDVHGSEKEVYKKDDIILFDKSNKIVRFITEEEIKNTIETRKENFSLDNTA